jgi:hypothetical protein
LAAFSFRSAHASRHYFSGSLNRFIVNSMFRDLTRRAHFSQGDLLLAGEGGHTLFKPDPSGETMAPR